MQRVLLREVGLPRLDSNEVVLSILTWQWPVDGGFIFAGPQEASPIPSHDLVGYLDYPPKTSHHLLTEEVIEPSVQAMQVVGYWRDRPLCVFSKPVLLCSMQLLVKVRRQRRLKFFWTQWQIGVHDDFNNFKTICLCKTGKRLHVCIVELKSSFCNDFSRSYSRGIPLWVSGADWL